MSAICKDHYVYRQLDKPDNPLFDVEIAEENIEKCIRVGWLPLKLAKPKGRPRYWAVAFGDQWITAPRQEDNAPGAGSVSGISAAECMEELRERKLWVGDFYTSRPATTEPVERSGLLALSLEKQTAETTFLLNGALKKLETLNELAANGTSPLVDDARTETLRDIEMCVRTLGRHAQLSAMMLKAKAPVAIDER